jgi:phosphoenolpyruvate carboxykinase (ATP)
VEYYVDPIFGFEVPKNCPGIPDEVLYPSKAWQNEDQYWDTYRQLAARYIGNFKKFAPSCPPELEMAGPLAHRSLSLST